MRTLKNPATGKYDLLWLATLAGLTVYSAFAYLFQLAQGQRSEFYAAIATSMSKSLGNWWWGAADPGATITLDKIPGSYWVPAIFVKLFGFSTWSVNAANAIATIAMVIVVAYTGRLLAGRSGGLIAGAVAATTPILAAVARSNQPESYFLLWIAVAAYFGVKATKLASFKHLMLAGVFIALAFNCYMLVAWAAWPALGLAWLTVNLPWSKKIWQLLAAGFTSLGLSLVWIVSVWLTPASARPYIGGSNTNSAWEMVFGYNGLGRFSSLTSGDTSTVRGFTPPFSGQPGWFRLLNSQLLPQIGWLIPAAIVAIIVLVIHRNLRPHTLFTIAFFVIYAAMFSVVSGMHQFYTAQLGIGISLVSAAAFGSAMQIGDKVGPVLILATAGLTTLFIAIQYFGYQSWAPIVQLLLVVAAVVVTLVGLKGKAKAVVPVLTTLALVFSPAVWAADTYKYPSSINPVAGPSNVMGTFGGGGFGANGGPGLGGTSTGNVGPGGVNAFGTNAGTTQLIEYLKQHRGAAKYLVAMFGTMTAAPYITASGEAIVPIGGFDGSDPSPTLKQLKSWIANGDLKYFLVDSKSGGFGGGPSIGSRSTGGPGGSSATSVGQSNSTAIRSWVTSTCTLSDYAGGGLYRCLPANSN